MARTALTIVGGIVGAYFGYPQLGMAVGSLVGNAVDPQRIQGPKIGETGAQTSAEGAPRAIVYGVAHVTGNVLACGPLVKGDVEVSGGKGGPVQTNEIGIRTFAIRICEGPIAAVLRVWEDNKLVVDYRTGSAMVAESNQWMFGVGFYYGTEDQMPDAFLNLLVAPYDHPAHRGTAYMVVVGRDLTDRRGSLPQYRFEVARSVTTTFGTYHQGPVNSSTGYGTYLTTDLAENPVMLMGQNGDSIEWGVGSSGSFTESTFDPDDFTLGALPIEADIVPNTSGTRIWPFAISTDGFAVAFEGSGGYCNLVFNGGIIAHLTPSAPIVDSWYYTEGLYYPEYGGLAWFVGDVLYLGVRKTTSAEWNCIFKFPLAASGTTLPLAVSPLIVATGSPIFWMHVSRSGIPRAVSSTGPGEIQVFDTDLDLVGVVTMPAFIASRFPSTAAIVAFGVDEVHGIQAYMYVLSAAMHITLYDLDGNPLGDVILAGADKSYTNRIVFTANALYIQAHHTTYKLEIPQTATGQPMILGDIVADIADRCDVLPSEFDVSELTDEVAGLVLAGDYTGGDAINTLRSTYFFDKAEYEKKLWFPKRGKPVVDTLTIDDLTEIPDLSRREQTLEFPKKMHLQFQHANSGYATVKATSARSSQDARVVGEVASQTPVVLNEDQAAQTVAKMHKVAWTEADGEFQLSVPESMLAIVPSDCVGLSLRGTVNRYRVEKQQHEAGMLKWTLRRDRQSAYTSDVTGIPIPEPTPPPPSIVGNTILVVADISPRQDGEDDLHYLVAVTGENPAWYGAVVQRSLDGGASYTQAARITTAARIGELLNVVPDADENVTDTTNTVQIRLYRDTQSLDSITETEFLAEGGAFLLENADGSWEVMQYLDAVTDSAGDITLSTLHRGRLNSGTSAHAIGAKFVMLQDMTHVPAQSAWIGQTLTHRAPSFEQAAELALEQDLVYEGNSQIEWPVASLVLARDVSNIVTGSWAPRYRLGTDDAPVNSANMTGFRITIVGSSTVVLPDQTTNSFSYDASALGASVVVSVQALNRFTGPGPATSGTI